MKIKTISRSEDFSRASSLDIYKVQKNLDPDLHPFERAREYTLALNATKLSRLFAKPFLYSLSGHVDGIYSMAKHPQQLTTIASGSGDGEIKLWSLSSQSCSWSQKAHKGFVHGITFSSKTGHFVSVGDDKCIKLWDPSQMDPVTTWVSRFALTGVDHHRYESKFATSSNQVDIWEVDRTEPTQSFSWGAETITAVKMNPTERDILASCGTDRTIAIYDLRSNSPLSKVILSMRTNAICWNPMEALNFSAVTYTILT